MEKTEGKSSKASPHTCINRSTIRKTIIEAVIYLLDKSKTMTIKTCSSYSVLR